MAGPWEKYGAPQAQGRVFTLPPSAADQRAASADARAAAAADRAAREWAATHNPDGSPKDQEGALSPEAITFNAQQYLATGQMPTLGMGKQAAADREAILNMAAKLAGATGMKGADLARQIAHYRAGTKQLGTLEQQLGTIRAAEQTALANGQQYIDRSMELPAQTPLAPINSITQTAQRLGGGTTISAADAAFNTFAAEYAKVVAGSPSGAGVLSDSARHEAQETLRSNASPAQKQAAFEQMKRDMENRIAAIHASINEGYKNLTEKPGYEIPDSTAALPAPRSQEDQREAVGLGGQNPVISGTIGPDLAGGGDSQKSLPIPPEMQAAHAQYLAQHWGNIDPNAYADFRAQLDKQFGFAPRMDAYRAIVPDLNKRAQQGGSPDGLNIPPVNAQMNGLDKFNASLFSNPVGAFALGAGSLGGGMDEVAGALKAPFTGRSVADEITRANAIRQASAGQFSKANFAGNLAGSLGLGAVTGGLGLAAESPIIAGAGFSAANGFLENNNGRLGGMVGGGLLGGAGGAAGKYLAAPVAKAVMDTKAGQATSMGARKLYNGLFGNRVAPQAVVPSFTPGERSLPDTATLAAARQNMQDAADLGLPYALADADPKLRALAGSVARYSPDAGQLAENTFNPRALGQADRAVSAIDTHLAPITNIEQRGADLLAAGDQAAGPSYNLAFQRPGPVDPQISAMLDTPAGRASLAHARTIAANRQIDPNKVGFDLDNEGNVVLKSVPSYETLQLVKRGMDAHLNSLADQFGQLNLRGNPLAQSVMDLKGRFNTRLGEINPNYAEGNRIWSGFAQRKDALDQGYKVLPNNAVPQRQFDASLAGMTPETLPEAQMGFATNMADTANRARLTADPYNSIYGSPLQQQKVASIFPEGAGKFDRIYNLERDMAKTRTETLGGSQTQPRAMADQAFANNLPGLAIDASMALGTGGASLPMTAARLAGPTIRDKWAMRFAQKRADSLAPVLFNTDPAATLTYIDDLALRKAQDEMRKQAFTRRYGLFGAIAPSAAMQPN